MNEDAIGVCLPKPNIQDPYWKAIFALEPYINIEVGLRPAKDESID